MNEQTHHNENELAFIDLLRIVWKWKKIIIGTTIIVTIFSIIFAKVSPPVYKIDMLLQPGSIDIIKIKGIIEDDLFNNEIKLYLSTLDIKTIPEKFTFIVKRINDPDTLLISYKTSDKETGIKIMNKLNMLLSDRNHPIIEYSLKNYYKTLLTAMEDHRLLINQISDTKLQINLNNNLIQNFENDVKLFNNERNIFFNIKNKETDTLTILHYSNSIQNNLSLVIKYRKEIYDREIKNRELIFSLSSLENKAESKLKTIQSLESLKIIHTIKKPAAEKFPVSENKIKIVLLTFMSSLFIMIVVSFLFEYIHIQNLKIDIKKINKKE